MLQREQAVQPPGLCVGRTNVLKCQKRVRIPFRKCRDGTHIEKLDYHMFFLTLGQRSDQPRSTRAHFKWTCATWAIALAFWIFGLHASLHLFKLGPSCCNDGDGGLYRGVPGASDVQKLRSDGPQFLARIPGTGGAGEGCR